MTDEVNLDKEEYPQLPNLLFELVVGKKDGSIDNPSIPVRWCLTKELLDYIRDNKYHSPQILIQVQYIHITSFNSEYVGREERHLFSLDQFVAYIPLSRAGQVKINAFIIGLKEGELKCYSRAFLATDTDGNYLRYHFEHEDEVLTKSIISKTQIPIEIIARVFDFNINVPEELFGKKPPTWLLSLVNRYQDKTLVDQCALRRRLIMFPFKYLLMIIPEAFFRVIGIVIAHLCLWFVGFRNLSFDYWKHPLLYGWDYFKDSGFSHQIQRIGAFEDLTIPKAFFSAFNILYRIPIIYLLSVGLIPHFTESVTWEVLIATLLLGPATIVLVITIVVAIVALIVGIFFGAKKLLSPVFTNKTFTKIVDIISIPFIKFQDIVERIAIWIEDRANQENADKLVKLEKYLTCNGDPHSVTADVDLIPFKDQTTTLRYTNFKNKVCKPLSR